MSRRSKALRYYRSSKPKGPLRKALTGILKIVVILFVLYHLLWIFFLQSYSTSTTAMKPTFDKGDTIITTPLLYGPQVPVFEKSIPALRPPRRGDIVIVRQENNEAPWYIDTLDLFVRFFTLQRVSLIGDENKLKIPETQFKRVIGVPGDTVKMEQFRIQIKTQGKNVFLDEREILRKEYEVRIPESASTEHTDTPFSGYLPSIKLEEGEYLLLPDNRIPAAASENWKATDEGRIKALTLFRYHLSF